ncbi:vitamin D 25-hydroxylase-like [Dermacentor variabilis]|uniref:vitamin D 25-hydroxylase-like n=1 Tax=Dermacentor variabilis TaxID=34621 RepID=UPI003F5B7391
MALLSLAVALALVQRCQRPPTTLPAGPRGVPLLGNLLSVGTTFHFGQCPRWAALYGTVFMVKLAGIKVVILNDCETVKKWVTRKELLHRSKDWALTSTTEGLSALNGKAWKENRRVCMQAMAELGFGKDVMWIRVQDEVQHLVETLAKYDGKPVPSRRLLAASVCNCVALYLFGHRYDLDDPRRHSMDRQVEAFFRAGASTPVEFLPAWLRRLARLLLPDCRSAFVERFAQQVTEFSSSDKSGRLAWQVQRVGSYRAVTCLVGNVTDLLLGGTAASTLFLHWQLLNVAARADTLQVALQREIDAAVGRDRSPAWGDRARLPLVMACVWETLRWKAATPLGIPRGASEDVVVDGLLIPKGTTVMPNLWAVHMDPKMWKDPAKFDPTRFLPADGSALTARPEHVIPFSIGKRSCPGEALAIVEMFLYTTHLLHAFRILPGEDQEGLLERVESLGARSNDLASVRLRFFRR